MGDRKARPQGGYRRTSGRIGHSYSLFSALCRHDPTRWFDRRNHGRPSRCFGGGVCVEDAVDSPDRASSSLGTESFLRPTGGSFKHKGGIVALLVLSSSRQFVRGENKSLKG